MEMDTIAPALKEVKPITFLYFRAETDVSQLANFMPVAKELFKEAVHHNLRITGPVHWHYFGFSPDAQKSFTLEVALPVAEVVPEYDGSFHFKRTEAFKCASVIHEGSWGDLPASYNKLMKFMAEKQVHATAVSREIYVNADFEHPDGNVTEIQVGVE